MRNCSSFSKLLVAGLACLAAAAVGGVLYASADDEKPKGENGLVLKAEKELTPFHLYKVKFEAGKTYTIDMIAQTLGFDPYLRLQDDAGKVLAQDDDSGEGLNARIVFPCSKSGTYQVIATAYRGNQAGKYQLTVRAAKSVPVAAVRLALKEGMAKFEGKLTAADARDRVRKNSACKILTLKMAAGKTYQLDMVSKRVDSYLRLENADGEELAHDDDGGGFPNARITFECSKDGTYRIIATTFVGGMGEFTLTVQER
jgi:hypothetical protein